MEKKLLENLKKEIDNMEVQMLIQKTMLEEIDKMTIPGSQSVEFAKQKSFLESTLQLNQLVIASLKDKIKKEEEK